MEQQIAKLSGCLLTAVGVGGIDELVGLLQRVGDDVIETLLPVPGAFTAKDPDNPVQLQQVSSQPAVATAAFPLLPVVAFLFRCAYSPAASSATVFVVVSLGLNSSA